MADLCAACDKPITTVRASNRIITLERVWVHYSRRANRSHRAIPPEAICPQPAPAGGEDSDQ